ncbi:ferritin family protein [Vibrio algicola]|uniref:Rubrerythrin n=1 Tax=Vibrio algicola TaxID=2662262 RepID=A0A5Q0TK64_9VIBR|nr:ferritin family protein [Vibrio algicola]
MIINFNANEVLIMAEEIEKQSCDFYVKAAEQVESQENRDFLLKLASFEFTHKSFFKELRAELGCNEKEAPVFDPNNEASAYCRSFAQIQSLFDGDADFNDMLSILKFAINKEKDAILFYSRIKEFVPEVKGSEKLDEIIAEEHSHIKILTAYADKIAINAF